MQDMFNRKITYARISVTDLCNFRCQYCMPERGIEKKAHSDILTIENFQLLVDALCELGFDKIRLTGGEPLVRKGVDKLISYIGEKKQIKEIGITTNGSLLAGFAPLLKASRVTSVNISLDTLNEKKFEQVTRGGNFKEVLRGIEKCHELGLCVKTNTVLMKGINDEQFEEFIEFSKKYGCEVRFIELMPMNGNFQFFTEKYVESSVITKKLSDFELLENSHARVAKIYQKDGARVGVISPMTEKFCDKCNRIRFTADGFAMNCLHDVEKFNIKDYMTSVEELSLRIVEVAKHKKECHSLEKMKLQKLDMNEIGG